MTGLGSYLRGVRDDSVFGNRAILLNTGVQIQIWEGKAVVLHLQPFLDAGLAVKYDQPIRLPEDFYMGIGSELILFFPTLPSLQVRGWFGFDPTVDGWSKNKWELGLSFDLLY